MKAIINGNIVTETGIIENGTVKFSETITEIGEDIDVSDCDVYDAGGKYVIPGLVDIHIHGYRGDDVSDADIDGVLRMSYSLTKNGVTSWCPTTMTVDKTQIISALDTLRDAKTKMNGAKILGANVEGPFINVSKKGAQSEEFIINPDAQFVLDNKDIIKLVTVAPETDGGMDFVRSVTENSDVTVSVGHTEADYSCTKQAIANGATHITHLFNAMPSMTHRSPGVIGAALENDNVSCELIADTFHINPALYKMLWRTKGEKLILITDCMRAGGLTDGEYTLGGQPVTVKGIECRLSDGTIAGSILTLNKAVYNFAKHTGIPLYEAVKLASLYPAQVVGESDKIGSITVGKCADLVISDADMNIYKTYINGKEAIE